MLLPKTQGRYTAPLLALLLFVGLLAGSIALAQVAQPTPLPLYAVPNASLNREYTSGTLALAEDGRTLVASNMLNDTISVISVLVPTQAQLQAEINVGRDPRGLAVTPDSRWVLVANRGADSLAFVDLRERRFHSSLPLGGSAPYAVVSGSNDIAYVSMQGSDEVVIVDIPNQQVIGRMPVPAQPAGLALYGDFLYVTHFWSGDVTLLYLPQRRIIETTSTGVDTGLSQSIQLDITRGVAYLPQTRSNAQNRELTFDTIVFPVVNVIDLRNLSVLPRNRVTLDTADRPVNMPFDAALDRFRNWLFVANAGTNDISVIDINTGLARANIKVGSNPRGILLNRDNAYVFAHNTLDGTLTIIDTNTLRPIDVLPISNLLVPVDTLFGSQFFYGATDTRLAADGWVSCANCHFDGMPDGRTWAGFADGPRQTPPLYNLLETVPYNWSGTWDEIHDVELKIRNLQAGDGFIEDFLVSPPLGNPHAGASLDLDTLASYLLNMEPPTNPNRADPELVARGEQVFNEAGCAACHSGPAGTNLQAYDLSADGNGPAYDTPSLRYLWLSAPYLHDGSAATLEDLFMQEGGHQLIRTVPLADIDALIAYLLTWES